MIRLLILIYLFALLHTGSLLASGEEEASAGGAGGESTGDDLDDDGLDDGVDDDLDDEDDDDDDEPYEGGLDD